MKNITSEKKDATLKINWDALEIFWADQYAEDYVTTLTTNFIIPSFLSMDFSRQFKKEKVFSQV